MYPMAGGNSVSFGKAAVTAPARARRSNEVRELCSELRERFLSRNKGLL